jgi:hypothetical protein
MSPPVEVPPTVDAVEFVVAPTPALAVKNEEPKVVAPPLLPADKVVPFPAPPPPPPTMRTKMAFTFAGVV